METPGNALWMACTWRVVCVCVRVGACVASVAQQWQRVRSGKARQGEDGAAVAGNTLPAGAFCRHFHVQPRPTKGRFPAHDRYLVSRHVPDARLAITAVAAAVVAHMVLHLARVVRAVAVL